MPLIGAGRNISPRIQAVIDAWLTENGYTSGGGGGGGGGALSEDFDGSLTLPSGFTTSGDVNWFVQGSTFFSAPNSAESGNIHDNESTSLFLVRDGITAGMTLTFRYKTDTEATWDPLHLFINGTQITTFSGNSGGFQTYSTSLFVGLNTIEWRYTKDVTFSSGADTVWIDDVVIA